MKQNTAEQTAPNSDENDELNRKETAHFLGIGVQSVLRTMNADPTFPRPVRRGKRNYWVRGDLRAWQNAHHAAVRAANAERLAQLGKKARR